MNKELVEDNIKFAYFLARKWNRYTKLPLDDCVSISLEGLCKAAKNYDIEKSNGSKFITYAGVTIDCGFKTYLRDQNSKKRKGTTVLLSAVLTGSDDNLTLLDTLGKEDDYSHIGMFPASLTDREKKIIKLRLDGLTQEEVANEMGISQVHVGRILKKVKRSVFPC